MKVLFATDGGAPAEAAGRLLTRLLDPDRNEVRVLYAYDQLTEVIDPSFEDIPFRAEKELLDVGLLTTSTSHRGGPTGCIDEALANDGYGLVAMGAGNRSRLDRYVFGSVSKHVLRHSRVPVLVVHRPMPEHERVRILVGTDGSAAAERAMDTVIEMARPDRVDIDVRSVVSIPDVALTGQPAVYVPASFIDEVGERARRLASTNLDQALARFRAGGFDAHGSLGEGSVAEDLLERAALRSADLVAVGAHRAGVFRRLATGSVSARVAERATATLVAPASAPIETDEFEEPNGDVSENRYPVRMG